MNYIDLGCIDRLVRRNSNLLTAFKVIDEVDAVLVVENIRGNIAQFGSANVIYHNRVLDIVAKNGTIVVSYYFADRYSKEDVAWILAEIREFCECCDINYAGE